MFVPQSGTNIPEKINTYTNYEGWFMKLKLTSLEQKQLLIWAENTISGGHYGDSDVVFPEESITLHKLENASEDELEVSERDVRIMLIWCENAIGSTLRGMTSEETSLIAKLKEAAQELDSGYSSSEDDAESSP